jgi:hypothetical protein
MDYEGEMDEPGRILDLLWYTRHIGLRAAHVKDRDSAHELLAICGASIQIMKSVGWKNLRQFEKIIKLFDTLFTEHIKAIDNPILGEDELWEVIDGIERSRPGLIFFDIECKVTESSAKAQGYHGSVSRVSNGKGPGVLPV